MSSNATTAINPADLGPLVHALAGASGGIIAVTMTMPLYTLSTKLQADKDVTKSNNQVRDLLKRIYQLEGVTGYYAGLQSALFGNAVTNFIYFYAYEIVSRAVLGATNAKQLSAMGSMLSGAMAGSMSAICTNPIWVVNTRSTVENSSKSGVAIMIDMIREDGPLALFKGIKPALLLVSNPVIQYTVYERLQNIVLNRRGVQALTPLTAAGIGVISKVLATLCTYPYSTVKTRMHLQKGEVANTNVWGMLKDVVRKDGIKGLYQGVVFKLIQVIFGSAFLFYFKQGLTLWAMKFVLLLRRYRLARQKMIHL